MVKQLCAIKLYALFLEDILPIISACIVYVCLFNCLLICLIVYLSVCLFDLFVHSGEMLNYRRK